MNRFLSGKRARALPGLVLAGGLALAGAGCDTNKLVEVQDPGALRPSDLNNLGSVPALVAGAFRQFVAGYSGLGGDAFLSSVAVLTDEMYYGDTFTTREAADKRTLQPTVLGNISDAAYSRLHQARFNARRAYGVVDQFTTSLTAAADAATKAQLRAIEGFVFITLSEGWCGSVPFSSVPDVGDINPTAADNLRPPIGTIAMNDSAVVKFDQALALNPTNRLAALGKARALLNKGLYAEADAAVASVPTNYVFLLQHSQNTAAENNPMAALTQNGRYGVSNLEGASTTAAGTVAQRPDTFSLRTGFNAEGLPFRNSNDPRIPWEKRGTSGRCFSSAIFCWLNNNYPNFDADVPLASGVEARLVEAEFLLQSGQIVLMLDTLNQLRATATTRLAGLYPGQKQVFPDTGVNKVLVPLADPADPTTSPAAQFAARRDLLFRERAFWLYNTGHRLGDLRRLVRNYGLTQAQAFPSGPHFRGGSYGADVAYPIPFSEQNNPQFNPGSCSNTTA